jgi:hypothetical protein
MNRIKLAVLLATSTSIGWMFPIAARAEAPTPRGGCWSREIATRPLAEAPKLSTAKGRVIAIDRNNKDRELAAKEVATWVRIETPTGQKTVYLGSERSLKQQNLNIKVRDLIEVQGVQTYKSKKLPTIIASTVKRSDRVWKIANIATKPTNVEWCKYNG